MADYELVPTHDKPWPGSISSYRILGQETIPVALSKKIFDELKDNGKDEIEEDDTILIIEWYGQRRRPEDISAAIQITKINGRFRFLFCDSSHKDRKKVFEGQFELVKEILPEKTVQSTTDFQFKEGEQVYFIRSLSDTLRVLTDLENVVVFLRIYRQGTPYLLIKVTQVEKNKFTAEITES